MKLFWKAIIMTIALFVYGYLFSTAEHDHALHEQDQKISEEGVHDHIDHEHP